MQAQELGWATEAEIDEWFKEARREVDKAQAQASKEPTPDPYRENWRALSTPGLVEGMNE
jgi:pyruvate dehydrogenase E1 component alpha subunit/2-oxoisovalerate dehydrogenase E1 component alpha subunit